MLRPVFRSVFLVGALFLGSRAASAQQLQPSSPIRVQSVASVQKYAIRERKLEATSLYPRFRSQSALARYASWRVRQNAAQRVNEFAAQARRDLKEFTPMGNMAYDEAYAVHFHNPQKLISLSVEHYQFMGGAHGISGVRGLNFGIPQGESRPRALVLGDFFRKGSNYQNELDAALMKKLRAKKNPQPDFIASGDVKTLRPDLIKNFVVEKDGLRWFFPPYAIGAYASGPFEAKLLKAELGPNFVDWTK